MRASEMMGAGEGRGGGTPHATSRRTDEDVGPGGGKGTELGLARGTRGGEKALDRCQAGGGTAAALAKQGCWGDGGFW